MDVFSTRFIREELGENWNKEIENEEDLEFSSIVRDQLDFIICQVEKPKQKEMKSEI